MKQLSLILCLTVVLTTSLAQSLPEEDTLAQPHSASAIAKHLRNNYGMVKSAYLTQMAWKFAHSFASSDQLSQQWLQALDNEVIEYQQFNHINTHALMAQTLIEYSNGMNLNRWRMVDLVHPPQLPTVDDELSPNDVFQIWLNLPYFWQQIIDFQPQQTTQWLSFPEVELNQSVTEEPSHANSLANVLAWLQNSETDLIEALQRLDSTETHYHDLSVALMRQHHHWQQQNHLAFSNDWIEIYQLIELSPLLLTADEQQKLANIIDQIRFQWEDLTPQLNAIDERLHGLIEQVLKELPNKFKNPDHQLPELNQRFIAMAFGYADIDSYMEHPIRKELQENLEVCLNLSSKQPLQPGEPIADNQFNSCFDEFLKWGNISSIDASLSGKQVRLDNSISLYRALEIPSLQIPNILAMQAITDENCQQQLKARANLFEWLLAAETMAWFHDRWPGIFANKQAQDQLNSLISTGQAIDDFPTCYQQAQPLLQQFQNLQAKWQKLKQEINNQINSYAGDELSTNSDINLFGSIEQTTKHIPEGLVIKPCDISQSCGAYIELSPTIELMALFPNHLRLATQFGLGELSICYDQVSWQNRSTVPTHLDNNKIANFEGQLSLQLNGLYNQEKVFSKTLVSEQRNIYLFGENNEETLQMECPLPIIGKQINTTLDRGTFGLLPNRLTFLTAQKIDINAVINNNWNTWLASIPIQQEELEFYEPLNGVKTNLNDAFLKHVNALQQQIYRKLISSNPSRINDSALSKATFEFLNQRQLLNHLVTGLYPNSFHADSGIRAALTGNQRLIDGDFFKNAYESQTNVIDMMALGDSVFEKYQAVWSQQKAQQNEPESSFYADTLDELSFILTF